MSRFALTQKAVDDLIEIGRYTQKQWGKEQRDKYLALLDDAFHRLADRPLTGKACDNIRKGYRKVTVGKHIIFYRQHASRQIEIVRILHERMDVDETFQSE